MSFAVELLLRLVAHEGRFCFGEGGYWNMFDAVLVATSFVDMYLVATNLNLTFMRVLRLIRIVRALRMVRLLRFAGAMKSMRLMILAIIQSAGPLLIASFVLMMVIFIFAVVVLNGVAGYVEGAHSDDAYVDSMQVYFCSMPMTLLTLFMSITGGLSWWEVQRLLLEVHVVYGLLFVCFISIMLLAVLNIITGIFVNDALEMAASDQDVMMQAEQEMKLDQVKKLRQLFDRFDSNEKSVLTLGDFESHIRDPEVQVILGMLGLDISEAPAFFKLLDVDKSGEVEIDEFVMGCLNLKGKTKMMDMEVTVQDTRRMVKKLVDSQKFLNIRLDSLASSSSKGTQKLPCEPNLTSKSAPRLIGS